MEKIYVIGGGIAGLVYSINKKSDENEIIVLEKNDTCGKKILLTGNGKCNFWNQDMSLKHFHSENPELISKIITSDVIEKAMKFFNDIKLVYKVKNGYFYPFSNKAETFRDILIEEALKKGVKFKYNYSVINIKKRENKFIINDELIGDVVVLANGSKSYPNTGSTGDGYSLLQKLGHKITPLHPSLVPVITDGDFLNKWKGIRTDVCASIYVDGNFIKSEIGEVQLTDYGLSGICIFNLSRYAKESDKVNIKLDFMPFLKDSSAINYLEKFDMDLESTLNRIFQKNLVYIILEKSKIDGKMHLKDLNNKELSKLEKSLREFSLNVISTKDYDNAQVTRGGLSLEEINTTTLESKNIKNLYVIGELLDIDGDCGGYNIGFAVMSALKASI